MLDALNNPGAWLVHGVDLNAMRVRANALLVSSGARPEPSPWSRVLANASPSKGAASVMVPGAAAMNSSLPVLSVGGVMYHGSNWILDAMGGVSYQAIVAALSALTADPAVPAIVMQVNCGGGSCFGVMEFVDAIKTASAAKPVLFLVRDLCCSAMQWAAALADEVVATPTAMLGSIGTRMAFYDTSEQAKSAGVRVIPIDTGLHKSTDVDGVPITEEMVKPEREWVANHFNHFVADVATGRGIPEATVRGWNARIFDANAGLAVGLVDAIELPEAAMKRWADTYAARGSLTRGTSASRTTQPPNTKKAANAVKGKTMDPISLDALTTAMIFDARPDLASAVYAEAAKRADAQPAGFADLRAIFGSDAAAVVEAMDAKMTLGQARARAEKKTADALSALTKQVSDLTASLSAITAEKDKLAADLKTAQVNARGVKPGSIAADPADGGENADPKTVNEAVALLEGEYVGAGANEKAAKARAWRDVPTRFPKFAPPRVLNA